MTAHYPDKAAERAAVEERRRKWRESRCWDPLLYGAAPPLHCVRDKGHEASRKPTERRHHANGIDW